MLCIHIQISNIIIKIQNHNYVYIKDLLKS